VEYRFEGQRIFDEMMRNLRAELIFSLTNISPKAVVNQKLETELTKAAGRSIENADQIMASMEEFEASDFSGTTRIIEMADPDSAEDLSGKGAKTKTTVSGPSNRPATKKAPANKNAKKKSKKKQRQNKKKGRK
jgi:preprotein translocase subunit SecA